MNKKDFVDAIRGCVQDAAVASTISSLSRPPGRKPAESLVRLSAWFNELAPPDRQNLERVVEMAVGSAVFGFLCVLDGARAIENGSAAGHLDLRYRRGDRDISLNGNDGEVLHELL